MLIILNFIDTFIQYAYQIDTLTGHVDDYPFYRHVQLTCRFDRRIVWIRR